jgi:uncharacterized SAM-binding protein YcdF (DUF218 family)
VVSRITRTAPRAPRRARGWWWWAVRAALALLAALLVGALITVGQVWWVGRHDQRPRSDALLVLGASQYNGRPSAVFAARLDHALDLYRARVAPRIIMVGGKLPGDRYTEAEAGANYLARRGVPPPDLVVVPEGSDTLGSMTAAARVMNGRSWRSVVLVTDPWHSLRSRAIARDLGLAANTSPVRAGPSVHGAGTQARYILREAVGYRFYQLFHRSSPERARTPAV